MKKTILITAATSDLGSELARHLDQQGHTLLLLDQEQLLLESLDAQLNGEHTLIPFDIWAADYTQYQILAQLITEDYPALDALIFTQMYVENLRPIVHCDPETWLKTLQINLTSPLWFIQTLLPSLQASNQPSILFTTHDQHQQQPAYWHGFGVSQSALHTLITTLHDERSTYDNLQISIIDTGWIDTSFNRNIFPNAQPHWKQPTDILPLYEQALNEHQPSTIKRYAYDHP